MCELSPGERGITAAVGGDGRLSRRLLDLGLVEGSGVACLHRGIWGGIRAYEICGAVLALRDCDCSQVLVREIGA